MQKTIPDNSPLIASPLVCHQCGEKMKMKVVKNQRGIVEELIYECRNEKSGCSYAVHSTVMIVAEMKPIRPDGSEAKL
jgi:NifU-like protein involved in Fe-S cluster formation